MSPSKAATAAYWEGGKNGHVGKELPRFLKRGTETTVTEPGNGKARQVKGTGFEHLFEDPQIVEH